MSELKAGVAHAAPPRRTGRVRALPLVVLLLALVVLGRARDAAGQGSGPGTEFFECRDKAWSDANTCYTNNPGYWGIQRCEFALGADLFACDVQLLTGLFGW